MIWVSYYTLQCKFKVLFVQFKAQLQYFGDNEMCYKCGFSATFSCKLWLSSPWHLWSIYDSAAWTGSAQILCQMGCTGEQLVAEFAKACKVQSIESLKHTPPVSCVLSLQLCSETPVPLFAALLLSWWCGSLYLPIKVTYYRLWLVVVRVDSSFFSTYSFLGDRIIHHGIKYRFIF